MTVNTVSALVRRRRELTCEMNRLSEAHAKLAVELDALDTVLVMFQPDIKPDSIPALRIVSQPTWAKKGEITRLVLSMLRTANGPMTADFIAQRVAQARGEPVSARVRKSVYKVLDQQRQRGLVRSVEEAGLWLQWEVVR
jgi:hypothetical protein